MTIARISSAAPSQLIGRTDNAEETQQQQHRAEYARHHHSRMAEFHVQQQSAHYQEDERHIRVADCG